MGKNRLKIAFMIGTLNQGGLESLVVDIYKHHQSLDFDVVCLYRHEGNFSNTFHNTGVRMVQLQCKNMPSYICELRKFLLRENISLVHAHTQSNALVCMFATIGISVPVITTLHGFAFAKVNRLYRNLIYHGCKKILCVSRFQKQYYQDLWHLPSSNKMTVVYNGIDFSKIDSASPSPEFPQNERIRLAMVGSFMEGRSQHVIVKVINILKQRGITDFDFFFIGRKIESEPWRYDLCVQLCEEYGLTNVHFLGGRSDVPSLLKVMDGFVYSTEHDTFGIAVVEAMAAGLPVVVNDWDVMKEITAEGKWATFYKTNDIEDCANKMAGLINELQYNKKQLQEHTAQIAQEVRAKFSIENHIKQIEKVYTEVYG